jgi:hypothetical protein
MDTLLAHRAEIFAIRRPIHQTEGYEVPARAKVGFEMADDRLDNGTPAISRATLSMIPWRAAPR